MPWISNPASVPIPVPARVTAWGDTPVEGFLMPANVEQWRGIQPMGTIAGRMQADVQQWRSATPDELEAGKVSTAPTVFAGGDGPILTGSANFTIASTSQPRAWSATVIPAADDKLLLGLAVSNPGTPSAADIELRVRVGTDEVCEFPLWGLFDNPLRNENNFWLPMPVLLPDNSNVPQASFKSLTGSNTPRLAVRWYYIAVADLRNSDDATT